MRPRERLYVKYNVGLKLAYIKEKELEFNERVDREDYFKALSW